MQIQVNGEPHRFDDELFLSELIQVLGLGDQKVAVEINREIVPRSTFAEHRVKSGDQVEIVRAIGGG